MLELIQKWLANPSGRYFDGLAIFTQLASSDIKKKYLEYFKQVETEPKQHDIHFTMLINKVSAIAQNVQINPSMFENIELVFKVNVPNEDILKAIEEKDNQISELKAKIEELKNDHDDALDANTELTDKVNDLESDVENATDEVAVYESELEKLEKELEELKSKQGVQIVAVNDLPEDIKLLYARNQEITPLMASIHAQISIEGLHAATRKKLVAQLCELDDERRSNWDAINEWSEGKTAEPVVKEEAGYDPDLVIAGAQMARRIERLNENIKRSQEVADNTNKETIKANAIKRIEEYTVELEELKAKLTPAETEGSDVE